MREKVGEQERHEVEEVQVVQLVGQLKQLGGVLGS